LDVSHYLTVGEVAQALECTTRAVERAANRAEQAGHTVRGIALGRRVYLRAAIEILRLFYYPRGSDRHSAAAAAWGAAGGTERWRRARSNSSRKTADQ